MSPRSGLSPNRLASRTGWIGSVARFWEKTYAPDYVGFALLLTAYLLMQFFLEPFHQMFFLNDLRIQYPHATIERVPVGWNFVYAGGIPLATLVIFLGISKANTHKCHVTFLGYFIGMVLTVFITDIIKNAVGRPRPDLISRCKPASGSSGNQLVTIAICTQTDTHMLQDGWRSFPSGHSSFAFSGLGFLALFLAGQLHVFRPRTDLGRVLVTLAPILGAALIAISRCEDYRHDVYDVTCGSILGMSVAYFSYRRYFPMLHSPKCDEPYSSRESNFNDGFGKMNNDEEIALRGDREFDLDDIESEEGSGNI